MNKPKPVRLYETDIIKVPRFEESAGFYATAKSSAIMSKIRGKNTKAEVILRKTLWELGYRYRLHSNKIAGSPDIIFASKKIVVFVDGSFWHGYNWEEKKRKLMANKAYWIAKIERNMQRDAAVTKSLTADGWKVIRFWDHEIEKNLEGCVKKVLEKLK